MTVILLDADGPLVNLTDASVRAVNRVFGTDYRASQWTEWDATFMDKDHHYWMKQHLWNTHVFWMALPPTDGAAEGVRKLKARGHEIHVVTSAYESCANWELARRECLKFLFDIDKKFITVTAQKHRFHGDVFIDDRVDNVEAWDEHNSGDAYLFDMPHNQVGGFARHTWPSIVEMFG